ncbi:hypothetical protein CAOG_08673, partial [Capsaspora owczarzaki ATCC 30864]|uniref:hypothetical protein n=1 Tax=Capsaspora owczarzaki (strain ATCC 30864) TaxID=595528 RepID=UPI000352511D
GSLGSGVIGVVQQDEAAPAVVAKAADVQNEAKPAVAQVARDEAKPAVARETEAQAETKPAVARETEAQVGGEHGGTKRGRTSGSSGGGVVAFRRRRKRQKRRVLVRLVAAADALEVVLPEVYAKFADRFEPSGPKKLPVSRPGFDAVIRIDPSKQLRCDPNRKFGRSKEEALRKYVEDGLKTGMIVESESAFCSQPMFVKKGDGWRVCMDSRRLNEATIRDRYPSPDALALIDKLKGAKIFSKFDLTSAFWQVRLSADSEKYTAFPCDGKLYQHRVMCFGLVNAPAMFQRLINEVMGPLSAFAGGYFDDIIVFSKTPEEHELHVKQMLARLREFDLYVSLKKCVFGTSSVDFLGRRVSEAGVAVDPRKVQAVLNWKPPTDATGVREVNGLASFMRRHVPNYAELARPMTMLTRKNVPFVWSAECEKSFRAIQQALVQAPVLAYPDTSRPFEIFSDASDLALGGVLMQRSESGDGLHPVAYYSCVFTKPEINYSVYDKELLAILECLREWRHYVCGSGKITVWSDHRNLQWFTETRELTAREARWCEMLGEFDLVIKHLEGSKNGAADAMSRSASGAGPKEKLKGRVLDPELLVAPVAGGADDEQSEDFVFSPGATLPSAPTVMTPTAIREALQKAVAEGEEEGVELLSSKRYQLHDGLIKREDRVFVPEHLRPQILRYRHDAATAGHCGNRKTLELVQRDFEFPAMQQRFEAHFGVGQTVPIEVDPALSGPPPLVSEPAAMEVDDYGDDSGDISRDSMDVERDNDNDYETEDEANEADVTENDATNNATSEPTAPPAAPEPEPQPTSPNDRLAAAYRLLIQSLHSIKDKCTVYHKSYNAEEMLNFVLVCGKHIFLGLVTKSVQNIWWNFSEMTRIAMSTVVQVDNDSIASLAKLSNETIKSVAAVFGT